MDEPQEVLTIKVTLFVPVGLRRNIRIARVTKSIQGFRDFVMHHAPRVFPWADHVTFDATWDYRLLVHESREMLPETEENRS